MEILFLYSTVGGLLKLIPEIAFDDFSLRLVKKLTRRRTYFIVNLKQFYWLHRNLLRVCCVIRALSAVRLWLRRFITVAHSGDKPVKTTRDGTKEKKIECFCRCPFSNLILTFPLVLCSYNVQFNRGLVSQSSVIYWSCPYRINFWFHLMSSLIYHNYIMAYWNSPFKGS